MQTKLESPEEMGLGLGFKSFAWNFLRDFENEKLKRHLSKKLG